MKPAPRALPEQDFVRMGSEYATARDYLSRPPRAPMPKGRRSSSEPQHGSNDSDFGFPDQRAE